MQLALGRVPVLVSRGCAQGCRSYPARSTRGLLKGTHLCKGDMVAGIASRNYCRFQWQAPVPRVSIISFLPTITYAVVPPEPNRSCTYTLVPSTA